MNNMPPKEPYQFREPHQKRIYEHLMRIGYGPATFYMDARKLLDLGNYIEGTAHLIAHLFREIEGAIIDSILDAQTSESIEKGESKSKHRKKIIACLRLLGIKEADSLTKNWFNFLKSEKYRLYKLAHRKSLLEVRATDAEFYEFVNKFELFLSELLQSYTNLYFIFMQRADAIKYKASISKKEAKTLRSNFPSSITFGYLLPNLSNPRFLEPLKNAGFFITVNISEARYLANIAGNSIEIDRKIMRIILAIDTDDYYIISGFVDIALKMEPSVAAALVTRSEKWLNIENSILFPDELGRLIVKLARECEIEAAFTLAKILLKLEASDPKGMLDTKSARPRWRRNDNESSVAWHYREILKHHYPAVIDTIGMDALLFLCELLNEAIRIEIPYEERKHGLDRSILWRPAVEENEQNLGERIKEALVVAIRDNALRLIETGKIPGGELFCKFERLRFPIFIRIILHILRQQPEGHQEWIAHYLSNKKYFNDLYYRHEYHWLLHEQFNQLPISLQKRYLRWVSQGPKHKNAPGESERKERWQLQKLHPIKDHLPDRWQRLYRQFLEKDNQPEHLDFNLYHTSWWGPKSPIQEKQIKEMSVTDIIDYLRQWQPNDRKLEPTPQGLGRALEPVVAEKPADFVARIQEFRELRPTYGRHVLNGLRTACREEREFNWHPVISFCRWVVQQPRIEETDKATWIEEDPGWNYARDAIVSLITDGCKKRKNTTIPFKLQKEVWSCIEPITDDPNPRPEREAEYTGDYYTQAINSTRGKALEAVINYVFWCARETMGDASVDRYLERVPEAKAVLEKHLDHGKDPSLAIRSVYGFYFPYLWHYDHAWAQERVSQIFPTNPNLLGFRKAAWSAYIGYNSVYLQIFTLLRQDYVWAINKLDQKEEAQGTHENRENLTNHLIQMYLLGYIPLQGEESLLELFFKKADPTLRARALDNIGFGFNRTTDEIPEEVLNRAKELWRWRMQEAQTIPDEDHLKEIIEFGRWFSGKHFDLNWLIGELHTVLELTGGKIEPVYMVVDKLATEFAGRPKEVLECFLAIVRGGNEEWHHSEHKEKAKGMLRSALASQDDGVKQLAHAVINELLMKRHWEYRELLGS